MGKTAVELNTLGFVLLTPMTKRELKEGQHAVMKKPGQPYHIGILSHINNEGLWVMDSQGEEVSGKPLMFRVNTPYGKHYIHHKEWSYIINNHLLHSKVQIVIKPLPFKDGKFTMTCSACYAHFRGSKSQPYCRHCCDTLATATLQPGTKKKTRMYSGKKLRSVATEAFKLGKKDVSYDEFNNWLKDKLDGSDNDKEGNGYSAR